MITKEMTMGEIIEKYPFATEIMLSHGLHCIGCSVNPYESLENGAMGHGIEESEIKQMLEELNKAAENYKPEEKAVPDNPSISITPFAAQKVKEIMKMQNAENQGLRITVVSGGCSGKMYQMDFDDQHEGDLAFEENGVKVFVDKKSMEFLNGTSIDYIEGLQGSGFKLSNPNETGSCGCGKSVK
jgi:iron-sulfur cluster assembly accessory protein